MVERRGAVVSVGLNRPEVRNAVNQKTAQRLLEELKLFEEDQTICAAVLHGIGECLCPDLVDL